MPRIITSSDLQRHIGSLASLVSKSWAIVTSRGKAKVVILPYFDDNDEAVEEYLEEYEIHCNANKLRERYAESDKSGLSDLKI